MRSRDRKDRYVEAYWSRSGRYRSSAAVAGYGTEERVVISFLAFIDDAFAQFVIKTKKHVDETAEVVSSEKIDYCQTKLIEPL